MGARERCALTFAEHHPADAARLLERFPSDEAGHFLERLPPQAVAELLKQMSVGAAAADLGAMSPATGGAVVAALSDDLGASLLRRLPPAARGTLLEGLATPLRRTLERHLDYPEGTAGALADSRVPAFAAQLTVTEARRQLRQSWSAAHRYIYVTDDAHRLTGVVHAKDLADARPRATLASIMHAEVASVAANADVAAILAHPAWRELDPLPVVDRAGVFLGAIRHQKLRELHAPRSGASLTDTLLHLGELYWIGLSTVFPPVAASEPRSEEANHGA